MRLGYLFGKSTEFNKIERDSTYFILVRLAYMVKLARDEATQAS